MNKIKFSKKENNEKIYGEWEILIVDDEEEVHTITQTVLKKFTYDNKSLKIYHAFGEEDSIQIVKDNPNIALILLDVVMENSDSGLKVVKAVRNELNNHATRIILRTGQPGYAPEKDIILNYDINDYKEKTELTATKLFTAVITALRSFKELQLIKSNKLGLEQIITSNTIIYEQQTFHLLIDNILTQLTDLLNIGEKKRLPDQQICFTVFVDNQFKTIQCRGDETTLTSNKVENDRIESLFEKAILLEENIFENDDYVAYFKISDKLVNLIYFSNYSKLCEMRENLVEVFLSNIIVAIKKLYINKQMIKNLDNQNKELEIRVKKTVNEISKKDKLLMQQSRLVQLGEMINMIAHQWRQPLNTVAATIFGIKTEIVFWEDDDLLSTQKGRQEVFDTINKKLDNMESYVQSLSSTIDNFSNFYKPDKDKQKLSINSSIKQVMDIVESSMQTKSITINKEYHSKKELELFNHELMQVILNILKNAQDNFTAKKIHEPIITITTSDIGNGVKIDICDNGGGIEQAVKNKIYDPYFSTKNEKNGTGLGLYMSKMIIEEHHKGKLYSNNMKQGVCFSIELYE